MALHAAISNEQHVAIDNDEVLALHLLGLQPVTIKSLHWTLHAFPSV